MFPFCQASLDARVDNRREAESPGPWAAHGCSVPEAGSRKSVTQTQQKLERGNNLHNYLETLSKDHKLKNAPFPSYTSGKRRPENDNVF